MGTQLDIYLYLQSADMNRALDLLCVSSMLHVSSTPNPAHPSAPPPVLRSPLLPLVQRLPVPVAGMFFERLIEELDQLNVNAVGQDDQRVLRQAVGMYAAPFDAEAEVLKLGNGLGQLAGRDKVDDVIQLRRIGVGQ